MNTSSDNYSAVALCYQKLQQFDLMTEYYEQALFYAEEFYGKEHSETIQILANYSNALIEIYNISGDKDILLVCKSIMGNTISELDEENIQSADLMLKYATVLSELGEYETSNHYAEMACKRFQNLFGELDERMINIYSAIGDNYLEQSNKELAEKYYSLVIQTYEVNHLTTEEIKALIENALSEI